MTDQKSYQYATTAIALDRYYDQICDSWHPSPIGGGICCDRCGFHEEPHRVKAANLRLTFADEGRTMTKVNEGGGAIHKALDELMPTLRYTLEKAIRDVLLEAEPTADSLFEAVPDFARDYPDRAETLAHVRLPFYCINCQQKAETRYLTPNFGPLCRDCVREIEPLLKETTR